MGYLPERRTQIAGILRSALFFSCYAYFYLPDFKIPFNLHSQISSTSTRWYFGSFVHDAPISKPTATIGLTIKYIEQHG